MKTFLFGAILGVAGVFAAALLFLTQGGLPMAAKGAKPLPFEEYVAGKAIHGAAAKDAARTPPIPADEANLKAGAELYRDACQMCHGGHAVLEPTMVGAGMFPRPPRLMPPGDGVTDDPVGQIYWIVKHGIRMTGMPGFEGPFTDKELWQVSLFVSKAHELPESARAMVP